MSSRTAHFSNRLLADSSKNVAYSRRVLSSTIGNTIDIIHPWQSQKITSTILVRMLFYFNRQRHFTPTRPFGGYLKESQKILSQVGSERAVELMLQAYKTAKNPWGINYLQILNVGIEPSVETTTIWGIPF